MSKLNFGLKECSKCEYNVRCQECIYNKADISRLIADTRAYTVRKIIERLSDEYEFEWHADIDTRKLSRSDLIEWVTEIAAELLENPENA